MRASLIIGVAGLTLTGDERRLLARSRPAGIILFTRNIASADQTRALVAEVKAAVESEQTLVLVDQEGGRVQRIKPPLASLLPPAAAYLAHFEGDLTAAADAARSVARLLADELRSLAINTDCAPVLDVPVPGAHGIIGNRAFATNVNDIIALGRAFAAGLMDGAILPVMKHIPGHGRALADSHLELPVIDATQATLETSDLVPFRALADLPAAMTAHVVFKALDTAAPASTSRHVIEEIVRGRCGFAGLLMSDDLGMKALSGSFADRTRAVLTAGSDLALHCSGNLEEMTAVAGAAPPMQGIALQRFETAFAVTTRTPVPYDRAKAGALLEALVARVA